MHKILRAITFTLMNRSIPYTSTEVKLRESIYHELLKKMVSLAYDRLEELTVAELETVEQAARISGSKFWASIDHQLERNK